MTGLTILHGDPEPVEILIHQEHPFRKKPRDPETGKKRIGCLICQRGRYERAHLGAPPSMNINHGNAHVFHAIKHAWQDALTAELEGSALDRGLDGVTVEGLIGFPTLAERDQGNYRWMIEKALGDALVMGGWLKSDCFYPVSRYEFGGLQATHSPGESWIRLSLFPRARIEALEAA